MEVMDGDYRSQINYFRSVGVDLDKDSVILENKRVFETYIWVEAGVFLLFSVLLIALFLLYEKQTEKKVSGITEELIRINHGDYTYNMKNSEEGDLSILENEMYKTAIMLRESADNSRRDKESLKESLSDISHQLKTPLTSLLINLDNLYEHSDLPEEKRQLIVSGAKREVNKINVMVQQLLKLSRLDANAIEFEKIDASVFEIINSACDNVIALCDLKGIELIVKEIPPDEILCCDAYWEVEAISNILKNGVEHALSKVAVSYHNYGLYREIIIENDGPKISDEDARKIFTRYYRGESSTVDSVGIGLSLADSIVKQDGGYIVAEGFSREVCKGSDELEEGTRFILRYTGNPKVTD